MLTISKSLQTRPDADVQNPSAVLAAAKLKAIGDLITSKNKAKMGSGVVPALVHKHVKKISRGKMSSAENVMEKAVSAAEVFGQSWRLKLSRLIKQIEDLHEKHGGDGLAEDVKKLKGKAKKLARASLNKLKQFAKGETRLKPSTLAAYIGGSLGIVAGIATMQPEIVGASAATIASISGASGATLGISKVLETSGRGESKMKKLSQSALKFATAYPQKAKEIVRLIKMHRGGALSSKTKKILSMAGAASLAGAMAFAKWASGTQNVSGYPQLDHTLPDDQWAELIAWAGNGLKPAGGEMHEGGRIELSGYGLQPAGTGKMKFTKTMAKFLKDNPRVAGMIMTKIKKETDKGEGVAKTIYEKIKSILALAGALGIVGAYAFARWYMSARLNYNGPEMRRLDKALWVIRDSLTRDANMKVADIISAIAQGSGLTPAGGGALKPAGRGTAKEKPTRRKRVGTKKEVWDGTSDRTSGGLYKKDLAMNKRGKVVSKKQMERGRLLYKNLSDRNH